MQKDNDKYVTRVLVGIFLCLLLVFLMLGCKSPSKPTVTSTTTSTSTSSTTSTTLAPEPPIKPIVYPTYPKDGGYCTSGNNYTEKCSEGNCQCFVQLGKAIAGKPVDMYQVNKHAGPNIAKDIFGKGGSENIPVTCRAVKYIVERDPKWLEGYFDVQLKDRAVGFLGREILSNTYQALNVGVALTVRRYADKYNHGSLRAKADEWLRAYWFLLTLMSYREPVKHIETHLHNQELGKDEVAKATIEPSHLGGYGLVLPGNRSYINTRGSGVGLQAILFSMALGNPTTKFPYSLDRSPGYYGGLCAASKSLGYPVDSSGKVNLSKHPDPRHFGLSIADRDLLKEFVESNGARNLSPILAVLSKYKINCNLSIERTDLGLSAWFGLREGRSPLCARSKGGSYMAGTYNFQSRKAYYVGRAKKQNQPEAAEVWKDGQSLCEESELLSKKCIPFANGAIVHRIEWALGFVPKLL